MNVKCILNLRCGVRDWSLQKNIINTIKIVDILLAMWYNEHNKRDKEGELNDNDFISNSDGGYMCEN